MRCDGRRSDRRCRVIGPRRRRLRPRDVGSRATVWPCVVGCATLADIMAVPDSGPRSRMVGSRPGRLRHAADAGAHAASSLETELGLCPCIRRRAHGIFHDPSNQFRRIRMITVHAPSSRSPAAARMSPAAATAEPVSGLKAHTHIHGLAVDRNDPAYLLIATHHGLYRAGPDGNAELVSVVQDFMGFNPHPDDPNTLYASGHPAGGGNLGFIASSDGGKTWTRDFARRERSRRFPPDDGEPRRSRHDLRRLRQSSGQPRRRQDLGGGRPDARKADRSRRVRQGSRISSTPRPNSGCSSASTPARAGRRFSNPRR